MALWNGRLVEIVMTAREPAATAEYWAALLGGEPDGDAVLLGGGTRIRLTEGPREALAEARFEAGPELRAAAGGALAVTDPDGWRLRFDPVDEVEPLELSSPTLSHCTLGSPSPPSQRAFYESLTFLLSDQLGDMFCWLRPNPIHHSMAFAAAPEPNINHLAIELPDSAAFIAAIDRVVANGAKLEFGPGRHMVGNNLFAYLRDRHGIRWELCAEMARLDPDRPPGMYTPEDRKRSVNTFGPPPPESFIKEAGGPGPVPLEEPATEGA
jgi:catechol 2,3-dioxygenase-like lactoylglutathione lyase family enzyme